MPTHTGFCCGRSGGKLSRPFSQAATATAISSSDRVASSSSCKSGQYPSPGKEGTQGEEISPRTDRVKSCAQTLSPSHPRHLRHRGCVGAPLLCPNLRLIADNPALQGAGLGLLLEVGPEGQDTLLLQHSLCSSLTRLLRTQRLEPAVQGIQLLCGRGEGKQSTRLRMGGWKAPPPLLREVSPAASRVPQPSFSTLALSSYSSE